MAYFFSKCLSDGTDLGSWIVFKKCLHFLFPLSLQLFISEMHAAPSDVRPVVGVTTIKHILVRGVDCLFFAEYSIMFLPTKPTTATIICIIYK